METNIVCSEADVELDIASSLVKIADKSRNLKGAGLNEGVSTRMLIHAAKLSKNGLSLLSACEVALVNAITDDQEVRKALRTTLYPPVFNFGQLSK